MRIEKNDHQRENAFICYQILLTNSLKKKYMKISLENCYLNIGAYRKSWDNGIQQIN